MRLASVQSIREQLGFDDMTDINAAIGAALDAVTPQIASILGTSFERSTATDTFFVEEPPSSRGLHVSTEFRLNKGFLVAAPTMTVGKADRVDLEKGIVVDWTTRYRDQYVSFTYQYGFEVDAPVPDPDSSIEPEPPTQYVLSQVPTWLQEAARVKALYHLADNPSIKELEIAIDKKALDLQFATLVNRHQRFAPAAVLPL